MDGVARDGVDDLLGSPSFGGDVEPASEVDQGGRTIGLGFAGENRRGLRVGSLRLQVLHGSVHGLLRLGGELVELLFRLVDGPHPVGELVSFRYERPPYQGDCDPFRPLYRRSPITWRYPGDPLLALKPSPLG